MQFNNEITGLGGEETRRKSKKKKKTPTLAPVTSPGLFFQPAIKCKEKKKKKKKHSPGGVICAGCTHTHTHACTRGHACARREQLAGFQALYLCIRDTLQAKTPPIMLRRLENPWPGSNLKMCL